MYLIRMILFFTSNEMVVLILSSRGKKFSRVYDSSPSFDEFSMKDVIVAWDRNLDFWASSPEKSILSNEPILTISWSSGYLYLSFERESSRKYTWLSVQQWSGLSYGIYQIKNWIINYITKYILIDCKGNTSRYLIVLRLVVIDCLKFNQIVWA